MLNKRIFVLLALTASGMALAADPPAVQVRATRPDASATLERTLAGQPGLEARLQYVPGQIHANEKVRARDDRQPA